jgi:hypothetical protein
MVKERKNSNYPAFQQSLNLMVHVAEGHFDILAMPAVGPLHPDRGDISPFSGIR